MSWILATSPIWTPRNFTEAPTFRPLTAPGKKHTNWTGFWNILPDPTTTIAATRSAKLPTTNTPIAVGLNRLDMILSWLSLLGASQKLANFRILGICEQLFRITG